MGFKKWREHFQDLLRNNFNEIETGAVVKEEITKLKAQKVNAARYISLKLRWCNFNHFLGVWSRTRSLFLRRSSIGFGFGRISERDMQREAVDQNERLYAALAVIQTTAQSLMLQFNQRLTNLITGLKRDTLKLKHRRHSRSVLSKCRLKEVVRTFLQHSVLSIPHCTTCQGVFAVEKKKEKKKDATGYCGLSN